MTDDAGGADEIAGPADLILTELDGFEYLRFARTATCCASPSTDPAIR